MSTPPEVPAKTLMQMVATRIRVAMAVEDIRQSELSRRMGKNEQWLSVRLRGRQPIDVNDLLLFARALGVGIHDLLPDPDEAAQAADPGLTARYLSVAERSAFPQRPRDNRPKGRATPDPVAAAARTSYLDRGSRRRPGR